MKFSWSHFVCFAVPAAAVCLMLGEWFRMTSIGFLQNLREDILSSVLSKTFRNRFTLILVFYHFFLLWLKIGRGREATKERVPFWRMLDFGDWAKLLLVFSAMGQYAIDSEVSSEAEGRNLLLFGIDQSTNAMVFLLGIIFSQIAETVMTQNNRLNHSPGKVASFVLIFFLTGTALIDFGKEFEFMYRGHARASGPWVNPNTYGLLMGVGMILCIAFLSLSPAAKNLRRQIMRSEHDENGGSSVPLISRALYGAFFFSAIICLFGLIRSYSRGAWLGTMAGGAVLLYSLWTARPVRLKSKPNWFLRNKWAIGVGVCSFLIVVIFSGASSEARVAQRVASLANLNDFSWRNRLTAIQSSLQIISHHALTGVGWNNAQQQFEHFYAPAGLMEYWSIILNDYLALGMTLGLPALAGFIGLVWVSWHRFKTCEGDLAVTAYSSNGWWLAALRSALVILLLGFWFDGGLFKLALAVPFWLFLEMGRTTLATAPSTNPGIPATTAARPVSSQPRSSLRKTIIKTVKWSGAALGIFLGLTVLQVASMNLVHPPVSAPMCLRALHGVFSEEQKTPNRYQWREIKDLPKGFFISVWQSEDSRFFNHYGFDWIEIQLVLQEAKRNGRPARGASTITQQCARSLFLWQGRSWVRKGLEAYYTLLMELILSKKRILELYANVIEFGEGIYGLEAAAQHYYGKPAKDLEQKEIAMLVAIMPNPRVLNPLAPDEQVLKRQSNVLKRSENVSLPFLLEDKK